jgi:hypothetical protein
MRGNIEVFCGSYASHLRLHSLHCVISVASGLNIMKQIINSICIIFQQNIFKYELVILVLRFISWHVMKTPEMYRALRRIFGPKRDEVTGDWGKLHNEELHQLYSSSSIIRMVKSRRIR